MRNPLVSVIYDARLWRGSGPIVLVLFLALNWVIARQQSELENLRLRNLTSDDVIQLDGVVDIRYDRTFGENTRSVLEAIPTAADCRLVLLVGMSQMYSVNDRLTGDQTTSEEMDDLLRDRGTRVFGLAAPNLCNEEALFLLLATLKDPNTKPAVFIFGACFDKFRNVDLRPGYQRWLREDAALRRRWEQTVSAARGEFSLAADKMKRTELELEPKSDSADSSPAAVEARIREAAAAIVPAVAVRKNLYSITMQKLYLLRNAVFGIKSSSKRPMIPSRYQTNQQFFELMAEICHQNGVKFISYVIPFNRQAEHPYINSEYDQFKAWFDTTCHQRGILHANFEELVPNDEWGQWLGGPDFKHFRGAGHRRVARQLIREFEASLLPSDQEPRQ